MKARCIGLGLLLAGASSPARLIAQEAQVGVVVPVAITGGLLDTGRTKIEDPSSGSFTAGFRALATPQAKLGPHWYIYSAIQVRSTPFFYQDAYSDDDPKIDTDLLQAFVGYTRTLGKASVDVKLGKLSSAFGAFPLRYDDAANALLDQPLAYTYLALRNISPGGDSYGFAPVTLYGLTGAEIDVSWRRLDARFQLTNSSPYNPRSVFESGQHPQWTAGGGYTIWQGFRLGMSAFRGPWLDNSFRSFLPPSVNLAHFPASGLGVDVQWARGPWSASGEWDRFVFDLPNFTSSPSPSFGYVEVKRIISPRWYAAVRPNYQANNHPVIGSVRSAETAFPNRQAYEFAIGFRPDRLQLLKVGYEWARVAGRPGSRDNVFGVQFVTSINALSKALK